MPKADNPIMDILNSYVTNPIKKIGSFVLSTQAISTMSDSGKTKAPSAEPLPNPKSVPQVAFGYKSLPVFSRGFLKVAAISGLGAVVMSAYGSHSKFSEKF